MDRSLLLNPGSGKFLSVMIPSRKRFDKLITCLEKFRQQLGPEGIKEVEFILNFDSDDTETISRLSELPQSELDLKVIISDRLGGYKDLFHFYNQAARLSSGLFLLMWNDDATFQTDNWFSVLKENSSKESSAYSYWFAGTPTQILNSDGSRKVEDWPCFIAHHRIFYQIIGFYGHVGGVDSFLYYVLGPLGLLKKFEEIKVNHQAWFQIPEDSRDATAIANSERGAMLPTNFKVVEYCQQKIVEFTQKNQSAKNK